MKVISTVMVGEQRALGQVGIHFLSRLFGDSLLISNRVEGCNIGEWGGRRRCSALWIMHCAQTEVGQGLLGLQLVLEWSVAGKKVLQAQARSVSAGDLHIGSGVSKARLWRIRHQITLPIGSYPQFWINCIYVLCVYGFRFSAPSSATMTLPLTLN